MTRPLAPIASVVSVSLGMALATLAVAAAPYPAAPDGHVLDEPGALRSDSVQALESLLYEHDGVTGEQIVVAVLDSASGAQANARADEIFKAWKVGQRNAGARGTGALLVLFWKEREARIEVGYGLSGLLTDARARQILSGVFAEELRHGNPDRAMAMAAREMLIALESPLLENGKAEEILRASAFARREPPGSVTGGWWVFILVGIAAFTVVYYFVSSAEAHYTSTGWFHPRPWRKADALSGGWGAAARKRAGSAGRAVGGAHGRW